MFLILPKTLLTFFSWLKFYEGCRNYQVIPVHSRSMFILLAGAKKNGSDYFASLWLFCHWFGCYFASFWKIDTTSLHVNVAVYFAQIFKIFARIMANFSALGMRPHPLHPHAVRLCSEVITTFFKKNRQNAQILKSWIRSPTSSLESRSRSFWWSLGFSLVSKFSPGLGLGLVLGGYDLDFDDITGY